MYHAPPLVSTNCLHIFDSTSKGPQALEITLPVVLQSRMALLFKRRARALFSSLTLEMKMQMEMQMVGVDPDPYPAVDPRVDPWVVFLVSIRRAQASCVIQSMSLARDRPRRAGPHRGGHQRHVQPDGRGEGAEGGREGDSEAVMRLDADRCGYFRTRRLDPPAADPLPRAELVLTCGALPPQLPLYDLGGALGHVVTQEPILPPLRARTRATPIPSRLWSLPWPRPSARTLCARSRNEQSTRAAEARRARWRARK